MWRRRNHDPSRSVGRSRRPHSDSFLRHLLAPSDSWLQGIETLNNIEHCLIIIKPFPQTLFNSSKNVFFCVPNPGQRVIHRSTLHDAINEKEKKKKPRFLVEILTALAEAKGQPKNEIAAIQQENKVTDEAPGSSEENMDDESFVMHRASLFPLNNCSR